MSSIHFKGNKLYNCRIYTNPSMETHEIQRLYKKINRLTEKVNRLKRSYKSIRTQLSDTGIDRMEEDTPLSTIDDILNIQAVIDASTPFHSLDEDMGVNESGMDIEVGPELGVAIDAESESESESESDVGGEEKATTYVDTVEADSDVVTGKEEVVEAEAEEEEEADAGEEEADAEEEEEVVEAEAEEEVEVVEADAEEEEVEATEEEVVEADAEEEEVEATEEEVVEADAEEEEEVVEADAEEEEEVVEAEAEEEEEEVVEAEAEEEEEEGEEEEVEEYFIHGTRYYVSDKVNGIVYKITPDDGIGDMVGTIVKGKPYIK